MLINKEDIDQLDRKYRLNLINSITGIKPANLIGTRAKDGPNNLAIFSSVVHLGSHPAQIGLVMRPQTDGVRDTYANILQTGVYTINHVAKSFIKKAHYTSAKLGPSESEFERMQLKPQFHPQFHAPFVEESPIKIGMKHLDSITLPNRCLFIIGSVEMIDIPANTINDLGQINLGQSDAIGISGLNSYYSLNLEATFPYVRTNEIPSFDE